MLDSYLLKSEILLENRELKIKNIWKSALIHFWQRDIWMKLSKISHNYVIIQFKLIVNWKFGKYWEMGPFL